jgi:hypothetical protein
MAKGEIVTDYLKALVATGLYGATVGEVKERLVCEGIERALRNGVIPRRQLYFGYERSHREGEP